MNAYELAKGLDQFSDLGGKFFCESANMLRQQADRIAELSKNVDELEEELLKATHPNSEPVAWMSNGKEFYVQKNYCPNFIPLYTTPQKYCPTENNAAYEKGVIDGMAKQRQSRVDGIIGQIGDSPIHDLVHRTPPQIKELSDEELNKAFDYYCETDEGVLRFNYELRDEWKKEQLIRWKEAFKKASEK